MAWGGDENRRDDGDDADDADEELDEAVSINAEAYAHCFVLTNQ